MAMYSYIYILIDIKIYNEDIIIFYSINYYYLLINNHKYNRYI